MQFFYTDQNHRYTHAFPLTLPTKIQLICPRTTVSEGCRSAQVRLSLCEPAQEYQSSIDCGRYHYLIPALLVQVYIDNRYLRRIKLYYQFVRTIHILLMLTTFAIRLLNHNSCFYFLNQNNDLGIAETNTHVAS